MIKIDNLSKEESDRYSRLLSTIFNESFNNYPENAQKYFLEYWRKKNLEEHISKEDMILLVAKDGEKLVGYLIGKIHPSGNSSIRWLGVLSNYKGQGIGRNLVKRYEKWAAGKGAKKIIVSTANFNNERFYLNLGFTELSKRAKNDWGMSKLVFVKRI